jgi:hypothetical protein
MGSQAHGLTGSFLGNTGNFKQNPPGFHHSHPKFRRPLTGTHPGFSWTHGHGFIGENPDPDFATSTDVTGHGSATGLNLTGGNPGWLLSLETKIAKV